MYSTTLRRSLLRTSTARRTLSISPLPLARFQSTQPKSSASSQRRRPSEYSKPAPKNDLPRQRSEDPQDEAKQDPVAEALSGDSAAARSLLAPVHVPENPRGILNSSHPASSILTNPSIVVHRQLEMMNVMIGFEQANKYVILDPHGSHIGYMAETEMGMGKTMARQFLGTRRSFTTHVFDRGGREVLRFARPFQWINSRISVFDPVDPAAEQAARSQPQSTSDLTDQAHNIYPSTVPQDQMPVIGLAEMQWAPLRRRYNLFVAQKQPHSLAASTDPVDLQDFAFIDERFLSWDFSLHSTQTTSPGLVGSVNRNFAGFGRELFTDTGVYALRMDAANIELEQSQTSTGDSATDSTRQVSLLQKERPAMTLDERAVMLATAVSIDFDYFSHSRGGFMPMPIFMGGAPAEGAAGGAVGGAAGGAAEVGAGAAAGTVAESAAVGGATMAGYEAMQRARGGQAASADDASPQAPASGSEAGAGADQGGWWNSDTGAGGQGGSPGQGGGSGGQGGGEDLWGEGKDPWAEGGQQGEEGGGRGGGDGEGGGGGTISEIFSSFFDD